MVFIDAAGPRAIYHGIQKLEKTQQYIQDSLAKDKVQALIQRQYRFESGKVDKA